MSEIAKLNIHKKMLEASTKIERVAKNLTIEMGTSKDGKKRTYKAVSEGDVLDAVKTIEMEMGIYSYPYSRRIVESSVLVNEYGKSSQFMRIETVYRFTNIDNPTEYIEVTTYGDGIDSGDKSPGKAMTYADKYALLKAYKIETGDDPDKEASGTYKKSVETVEELNATRMADKGQKETIVAGLGDELQSMLTKLKVANVDALTWEQAEKTIEWLSKRVKK